MADGVYVNISAEQLDVLDLLDVLIILDDTGETEANLATHPTFTTTRVSKEGRVVIPDLTRWLPCRSTPRCPFRTT